MVNANNSASARKGNVDPVCVIGTVLVSATSVPSETTFAPKTNTEKIGTDATISRSLMPSRSQKTGLTQLPNPIGAIPVPSKMRKMTHV